MLELLAPGKVAIGNSPGWALTFHEPSDGPKVGAKVLEIDANNYHAEIEASLPSGLEGGRYKFVIEGLTDGDYGKIAAKKGLGVRLHLLWRDTNSGPGAYLANVAGLGDVLAASDATDKTLVAELVVTKLSRRVGSRRYEAVVEARERVYDKLARNLQAAAEGQKVLDTIQAIGRALGATVTVHDVARRAGAAAPSTPEPSSYSVDAGTSGVAEIRRLAGLLEEGADKFGRGMLLIRDGVLHAGERKIPLEHKDSSALDAAGGLIQAEPVEPAAGDPDAPSADPPPAQQFRLTLKGRPDLKPGDLVSFKPVPEDVSKTGGGIAGALGGLASAVTGGLLPDLAGSGEPVDLYVHAIEHKLGRTTGFSTVLTGTVIKDTSDPWDSHARRRPDRPGSSPATSPDGRAADAIAAHVAGAAATRRGTEIGEVRSVTTSGSSSEPPGQTETVWRGLKPADGLPNQARRLEPEREHPSPVAGVPYVTPFAWGKTGLVLPRYPGTRVVLEHRDGRAEDAIDIGALWESGRGPDSKAGDWWLILPVGVTESERGSIPESTGRTSPPSKATNDLIDADGHRVIEVGELTVRVPDALKGPGERPARAGDENSITIEHAKGAKVVMKSDGTIEITGKKITLDAGSGTIEMKASDVNVTVSNAMNVK